MGAATTEPLFLTPHEGLEGSQDVTNRAFVAGWAWDRSRPGARQDVEIRDGGVVLATIAADAFRKDLRDAGIGDGRHGFTYLLDQHIRDRRSHHIVVRIAGTDVALRDFITGAAARPVTRRDRPAPPAIPHFSMPPLQRWVYFTALRRLLRVFPHPVLRVPAFMLGIAQMILDRQARALNVALLRALSMSTSPGSRWRLHWARAYQRQVDLLLLAQVERSSSRSITTPGGSAPSRSLPQDTGSAPSRRGHPIA